MAPWERNQGRYPSFYSPPLDTGPAAPSQSPWSVSSQNSTDQLLLTLPMPVLQGEPPFDFTSSSHSSAQLHPEASSSSRSRRTSPPPQRRRRQETYAAPNSPDPFLTFGDPPSPPSNLTRSSSIVDLTETSPPLMASSINKRRLSAGISEDGSAKRKKLSIAPKRPRVSSGTSSPRPDIEELDLVDIDDDESYRAYRNKLQADSIKQQHQDEANKAVKLASFKCIICLDFPTDLTVTHCGHMFCSVCLHEALHAGTLKRTCPVCRTAIGATARDGRQPKNGVYALEMKLMTAKKKGKRPQPS